MLGGVRPEIWTARDKPFMIQCRNRRPTLDGLKEFIPFTAPVSDAAITTAGETKSWPFPQYFVPTNIFSLPIVAFADALYYIEDGVLELIDTLDPDDGTSKAIPAGRDWHFLETPSLWMMFNTECVVWRLLFGGEVYVADTVTINTGCTHGAGQQGNAARVLTGGFDPEDFFARADWPAYWAARYGDLTGLNVGGEPVPTGELFGLGLTSNFVRWSSILAPDALDLLQPGYLIESDYAVELRIRNEAGACAMPWRGTVWGQMELGTGVVVYGDAGITLLEPIGKRYRVAEFQGLPAGVGVSPGTDTRTHWAGDKTVHFFVDAGDELWRIFADGRAEHLGYKEFIAPLDRDSLLLAYDPMNDELYIGDGALCLLLVRARTESPALCEAPRMPSRIGRFGRNAMLAFNFPTSSPTAVSIETGTFTTGTGYVRTLATIWLKGLHNSGSTGWRVAVKYRTRAYDDWTVTAALTPDLRGVLNLYLPVLEWRLVATSTDQTKVTLEDIVQTLTDEDGSFTGKLAATTPGAATE